MIPRIISQFIWLEVESDPREQGMIDGFEAAQAAQADNKLAYPHRYERNPYPHNASDFFKYQSGWRTGWRDAVRSIRRRSNVQKILWTLKAV